MPRKFRMTRVASDSEDDGPSHHNTTSVPLTRYNLLPNGNLSSSTQILHIATADDVPEISAPLTSSSFFDDECSLDPAYLKQLNEEHFPTKQTRTYVNTQSSCFEIF